jgi:hypothetical protein
MAKRSADPRGEDAYVLQSLHGGPDESPHDKLVRLLLFIASLRDHGARRVTAVIPYLAYAHNLPPPVLEKAVEIANALLEQGHDEGSAIRIAIASAKAWAARRAVPLHGASLRSGRRPHACNLRERKACAPRRGNLWLAERDLPYPPFRSICHRRGRTADSRPGAGRSVHYENDAGERHGAIPLEAELRCSLEVVPTPEHVQRLVVASTGDRSLGTALALWSLAPKTWGRLYRIVEEVERTFNDDLPSSGLCSRNKLGLFKQCCQSADVAGLDSRHRAELTPAPKNPMSLDDSVAFVREILLAALTHLANKRAAGAVAKPAIRWFIRSLAPQSKSDRLKGPSRRYPRAT